MIFNIIFSHALAVTVFSTDDKLIRQTNLSLLTSPSMRSTILAQPNF
jgi:hypothetical protein